MIVKAALSHIADQITEGLLHCILGAFIGAVDQDYREWYKKELKKSHPVTINI